MSGTGLSIFCELFAILTLFLWKARIVAIKPNDRPTEAMALKGIKMKFRIFSPVNVMMQARLCWMALVVGICATITASDAHAQSYKIRAGDTVRVEVLEDPSLNRSILVAPDGRITVPTAGSVRAAGQSVEGIKRIVTNKLAGNFANTPNVFVSLEKLNVPRQITPRAPVSPPMISVYVMGEASKPGKIEVSPGTNILQMFAVMGGFTNFAAVKRIQLRSVNPKTRVQHIRNLNYKTIEAGDRSGLIQLNDGDTIVVPQRRLFE